MINARPAVLLSLKIVLPESLLMMTVPVLLALEKDGRSEAVALLAKASKPSPDTVNVGAGVKSGEEIEMPAPVMPRPVEGRAKLKVEAVLVNWILWMNVLDENVIEV
jgi:hypothetical protein